MKRRLWFLTLLALLFSALVAPSKPALAAPFTAANASELIAAIAAANAFSSADTIVLTADISLTTVIDSHPDYGDSAL
jgi:hypothetical protein